MSASRIQIRAIKTTRFGLVGLCLLVLGPIAMSQTNPGTRPAPSDPPSTTGKPGPTSNKEDSSSFAYGSPENEMRSKLELKEAKKQYDENVARAHEASQLASELRVSFESRQRFNSDDNKKLERVEKLTRKIRSEAGGSEGEPDANDIPAGVRATIKQIAEVAEEMSKLVEKTPRHVVSAAVIDQANRLITLIKYMRNPSR